MAKFDVAQIVEMVRSQLDQRWHHEHEQRLEYLVAEAVVASWHSTHPELAREAVEAGLAVLGAQRAMRILGVAARLTAGGRRGLPPDLVPRVHRHLRVCLEHPATRPLARWCAEYWPAARRSG